MDNKYAPDRQILLSVGEGPEGIQIFTSDDRGVVDWSSTFPAMYLYASVNGASVLLGPFQMKTIYDQLLLALGKRS
jgi:hypothetical protein